MKKLLILLFLSLGFIGSACTESEVDKNIKKLMESLREDLGENIEFKKSNFKDKKQEFKSAFNDFYTCR